MSIKVLISDRLLNAAQKLRNHRTKKEKVNAALKEYIQRRKQLRIFALFGKIDYAERYDYKQERRARQR